MFYDRLLAVVIFVTLKFKNMNDFQKLISVFDSIGCKYRIITSKEKWQTETHKSSYDGEIEWDTVIELDNGIGYYDFTCSHYFLNWKYQGHGCWE